MRSSILLILACGLLAHAASAQDRPIPRVAGDIRGAFGHFKQDQATAATVGATATDLPSRGWGLVGGAHVYPLRLGKITIGVGAELLRSGGSRTPAVEEGVAKPPEVRTHFSALSPELSFNFGHRDGWSYVSGGLGWATFYVDRADKPLVGSAPRAKSLNYGGGARWFIKKHIAFSADLRFYAISPQDATATTPALPRARNRVFSVGVGFR